MMELLFLLLPLAAYSGWWSARHSAFRTQKSSNTLKNLRYLVEIEDRASLETWMRLVDFGPETVELTLALGSLFRQRGEIERAIRIHQNLLTNPQLTSDEKLHVLVELAQNYLGAGVYDQAEKLFKEAIAQDSSLAPLCQRALMSIYEREKEWARALAIVRNYQHHAGTASHTLQAQYLCELAEASLTSGAWQHAYNYLKQALACDNRCVRASILLGKLHLFHDKYKEALSVYQQVEFQDDTFLPEVIRPIVRCYQQLGQNDALFRYVQRLIDQKPSVTVVLVYAELLAQTGKPEEGVLCVTEYLKKSPSIRALHHIINYHLKNTHGHIRGELLMLKSLIDQWVEKKPIYGCQACGYTGKHLSWQCPKCQQWAKMKPIQGIEGE